MAVYELLVRVVDKVNPNDPLLDAKCTKRGDVIAAFPAPHTWGKSETTNKEWRIIKADLTPAIVASLLGTEMPPDLSKEYRMLRKRAVRINIDAIAAAIAAGTLNRATIVSAIAVKARLPEPDVLIPTPRSHAFDAH
jgi:hypothetical protein